jgi:hypothetical protein
MPVRRARARRVAAASAEPPPMPEATGRFFSRVMATGGTPKAARKRFAAAMTRLVASPAEAGAQSRRISTGVLPLGAALSWALAFAGEALPSSDWLNAKAKEPVIAKLSRSAGATVTTSPSLA